MIRILLACGIGASTGFMAANMRKVAKSEKLDVSVHAVSKSQVLEYADQIDVLLLGPHFAAEVPEYKEMLKDHHVKVTSINPDYYSQLDGESILKDAIEFYNKGEE
jgi:PTS system cellobiose-specific IIB component